MSYSWKILFSIIALAALWFCSNAFTEIYKYARLNASTPLTQIDWSVKEISDESYLLQANYIFAINDSKYSGETIFQIPVYRNSWAAKQAIPEYQNLSWKAWYSPNDPQYSSLQKSFPIKECISALVLVGLFFYFIILKIYVMKRYGPNHS